MKRLIVNADDFGMTVGVTEGIIHCYQKGILTSTVLMANMPSRFLAAKLAQQNPSLGIGVHLNLTCYKPLLPPTEVPSLVDANGWFIYDTSKHDRYDIVDVEKELRAQVAEAKRLGINPTHIDLHMGTRRRDILEVILKIITEENLPTRRPPQEYHAEELIEKYKIKVPDQTSYYFGENEMTVDNMVKFLDSLPDGITEIMCHPGFVSIEHQYVDGFWHLRQRELEVLTHPAVYEAILRNNIQLVNFSAVNR
ncbi:hypothetical protein SAMN02746089_00268 [Caldanaerobius fijiensis DSM 17918]|uniref:Carbohydrate deacetylase n=1 Tax=Caldanaerobius fijiensis DSM 17918 TaxID=1121256 RepID=A0A1M4TPH9_9THEO|nr:ChbG/HpnK family deacetylase [Caldanaerobius fijiensis]SHE46286.1 hypothetical protein SAMN02746089_00268 [Caldanaerobius fijiensis DSM 17918]